MSPPHGGADRNMEERSGALAICRRPLTGARIETERGDPSRYSFAVAPSRGRGSKRPILAGGHNRRNGRPLTGARIETSSGFGSHGSAFVAPSRGRGSKPATPVGYVPIATSPPHGGADRNPVIAGLQPTALGSPPHGGADRNVLVSSWCVTMQVAPSRGRGSKPA